MYIVCDEGEPKQVRIWRSELVLIQGSSPSGAYETATKRSFARQTHLRARLLAVRLGQLTCCCSKSVSCPPLLTSPRLGAPEAAGRQARRQLDLARGSSSPTMRLPTPPPSHASGLIGHLAACLLATGTLHTCQPPAPAAAIVQPAPTLQLALKFDAVEATEVRLPGTAGDVSFSSGSNAAGPPTEVRLPRKLTEVRPPELKPSAANAGSLTGGKSAADAAAAAKQAREEANAAREAARQAQADRMEAAALAAKADYAKGQRERFCRRR